MARQTFPLRWSRGDALTVVTGEVVLEGVGAEAVTVYVDHSAVRLAASLPPTVELREGDPVTVELLVAAPIEGEMRYTDGAGFVLRLQVASGYQGGAVRLGWRRAGVSE
jgi:hypothetical protein